MSHESPVKQIRTVASSFNGGSSPMLPWTASSPLYQFDCFSPEGSNMSFTMTSPPFNYGVDVSQNGESNINSSFSPSIFSPQEQRTLGSRLPKKREVYLDHNNGLRNGIAEVNDRGSPESRSESRSALDLPLLLESPHHGFWSTFSNSLSRPGSNVPTPSHDICGKQRQEDRNRFWAQGLGGEADLLSATSQVMKISASPLLDGEFLLSDKKNKSRKGSSRRSPGQDLLAEDYNDFYSSIDGAATGSSKTARKRKSYVSPEPSSLDSSMELHTVGSVGTPRSPAIDKLSVAVRNQKFSQASTSKPAAVVGGAARRVLKSQPSVLENYDLSQHFDSKHVDETAATAADETNNTATAKEVTVCNCKKSKCLKLYCDCFAGMNYCSGTCNCFDCCNTTERESIRQEAIRATKERNALAFQTKINDKDQHSTGCHCKNSQCLKKYCECYTGGAFCGSNCKCQACLNFSGSADLAKARSSVREDGSSSSRKRKESPSSVAFLDQSTPPAVMAKTLLAQSKGLGQTISFSPELRAAVSGNNSNGYFTGTVNTVLSTVPHTRSGAVSSANTVYTPTANALSNRSTNSNLEVASSGSKRGKTQQTPVAVTADRQLRSRKPSADSEESVVLHSTTATGGDDQSISSSKNITTYMKQRHVKFAPVPIVYPFFGANLPETSKLIALKCLDFLEGRDIYAMSQVNTLWSRAAMDDALWE